MSLEQFLQASGLYLDPEGRWRTVDGGSPVPSETLAALSERFEGGDYLPTSDAITVGGQQYNPMRANQTPDNNFGTSAERFAELSGLGSPIQQNGNWYSPQSWDDEQGKVGKGGGLLMRALDSGLPVYAMMGAGAYLGGANSLASMLGRGVTSGVNSLSNFLPSGGATAASGGASAAAGGVGSLPGFYTPTAELFGPAGAAGGGMSGFYTPTAQLFGGGAGLAGGLAGGASAGSSGGGMSFLSNLFSPGNLMNLVGNVGGALINANASGKAADIQAGAANQANQSIWDMYTQNRADMEPWRGAGVNALTQLSAGTQPGGDLMRSFTMDDFNADPGYNFRLGEGLKAIERSAAARGLLQSGANLKGINRFAQDSASQEYGNAFNRFQLDQSNRFNRLAALSGIGQTAAQQLASQGSQTAQQTGQNTLAGANARASGYVGQSNALTGAIGNTLNYMNQNALLDRLLAGRV